MLGQQRIVLVTGGNRSLGYYACQQLGGTGDFHVILACRDKSKGEEAIQKIVADESVPNKADNFSALSLDVTDDQSIAAAAKEVESRFGELDVLLSSAGVYGPQEGGVTTSGDDEKPTLRQAFRDAYEVNLFGAAVLTEAFLPLIRASKSSDRRIVYVTSGLGSIGLSIDSDHFFNSSRLAAPIYRSTKSALNMYAMVQAMNLDKEGITTCVVDPGYCKTDFNSQSGFRDPREGAAAIAGCVTREKSQVHKKYVTTEEPSGEFPW